jgi:tetratricopeptide (TPR) repeat protein
LGVESGSPRILSLLEKSITPRHVEDAAAFVRKVGINLSVYFISDVPGETEADVAASIALIRRIQPDDGYVSPLAYYPGTRLFANALADGQVSSQIFLESHEAAVYAVSKPGRNSGRILKALSRQIPDKSCLFVEQKRRLGFCSTTNVLAGEWFRQAGSIAAAEQEFREITDREPGNPWGWYLLGELLAEQGKQARALLCYQHVLSLVPMHTPSRDSVMKLSDNDSNFKRVW